MDILPVSENAGCPILAVFACMPARRRGWVCRPCFSSEFQTRCRRKKDPSLSAAADKDGSPEKATAGNSLAASRYGDKRDAVERAAGVGEHGVGEGIVGAIIARVAAIERGSAFAGAQAAAPFDGARDVRERRGR
jgi:hypothetical protein